MSAPESGGTLRFRVPVDDDICTVMLVRVLWLFPVPCTIVVLLLAQLLGLNTDSSSIELVLIVTT